MPLRSRRETHHWRERSVYRLGEVEAPRKTQRQRTAHRPESLVGRNLGSLNRLEVLVRYPLASRKNDEFLQKDAPMETVSNDSAPKCRPGDQTRGVDFDTRQQPQRTRSAGQETLLGQGQSSRTVRLQTTAPQTVEEQTERLLCGSQR